MTRIVESLACLLIFCNVVRADCLTATPLWQNTALPPQTGQFMVEFDATPNQANMNGITAMSLGPGSQFDDFAILIRFKGNGRIVVRNGGSYDSDVETFYTVGLSHHFRVQVDVPNHRSMPSCVVSTSPSGSTWQLKSYRP